MMKKGCSFLFLTLLILAQLQAQRTYRNASVLASGNWYKIAVREPGVYKVDVALLNKLGINTTNLSSGSIRLFGNGGGMLPEACNGPRTDDLQENAIQVEDGGDGILNGNDYFLFYADGPDKWFKDSVNQRFKHQINLFTTESYYFISVGAGIGKRVQSLAISLIPNTLVTSFSERYFHELDSINFLSSGKDWYGEELSATPGHPSILNFPLPFSDIISSQPGLLVSSCVARSIGGSSRLTVNVNGTSVLQQDIPATGNTNFDLFARSSLLSGTFLSGPSISVSYNFTPGGMNAQGWIDWFEIFCRRNLSFSNNGQLLFRDWASVAAGNVAAFHLQNAAGAQVWDITNPLEPLKMNTTASGGELSFVNNAHSLHEYVAFSTNFLLPLPVGKVDNQNLHQSSAADLIIVCYAPLVQQAQRLSFLHQQRDNMKCVVVTAEQVFNEFSSGIHDPSAIRDFVKMYYDRAGTDTTKRPKYLLLFGDGSFDYKHHLQGNSNFVPAYENDLSLDPLSTYTSDDFYGFLDDNEDINSGQVINLLDIGIGRIPAQTVLQARAFVDKLIRYTSPESLGPWRNQQTFIADDRDFNLHFSDAEVITAASAAVNPLFIQDKIYLDAFQKESTPAGSRYPAVNQAINNQVQNGTLIWNYNGHGSYRRLAEEVILEQAIVDGWNNPYRLPLFVTATCDFAPYDNPTLHSLGENILLREKTGAIALMTTTRLVFAFSNRIMNRNYLQAALQVKPDGSYPSLGEAIRMAKNSTYQTQADINNNRKFTLLGDPALTLGYPRNRVQTTAINGTAVTGHLDTLKALEKYSISGTVDDAGGNLLANFNGTLYVTIFDKVQTIATRGNDPDSYIENFKVQHNQLFKGKVKVENGNFTFSFVVPKDINYQLGNGRISYYADNRQTDGNGSFTGFLIGGSQGISTDNTGPAIKAYLNDEKFVNGSLVDETPVLLLKLSDSSGINILETGIGHDITAMVDNDPKKTFVLNDFFESDLGSYQKGTVHFQLPAMEAGIHTIIIKVWDVANNSSQASIEFQVIKKDNLSLNHVLNYPNPFTTHTSFWFEHNRPNEDLRVAIQIYTITGKLVKTIRQTINTPGNRSSEIEWNATDDYGDRLARGVYIYQLRVTSADGKSISKLQKLLVL